MKSLYQIVTTGVFLVSVNALAQSDLDLEPCINGAVSSTGLFASQEEEDRFVRQRIQANSLDLEPCINGEVSESGLFSTQEEEDRHYMGQDGEGESRRSIVKTGDNMQ